MYRIKDVNFSELGLLGTKLKHAIVIWSKMAFGETPKAALIIIKFFNNKYQPRSQGFSLFVTGKAGKGPGTGRSHDFQHPDIVTGYSGCNKLS